MNIIHQTTLLNNNCLVELEKLQDHSIDCIITDPPYFIDKMDDGWNAEKISQNISNSHIKHIPKGMKFDKKQSKNLYEFYVKVSTLLFQKLKPEVYFLSFASPRLYHPIALACEDAGFEIRDMINWVYTQTIPKGMGLNHLIDKMDLTEIEKKEYKEKFNGFKTPMMRSCFEPICVAMKPLQGTFFQNENTYQTGLIDFSIKLGSNQDKTIANVITTEEWYDTWDKHFLISKPTKKEKGIDNFHPTVKPVRLIEHLLMIFSKKNSVVLDPFMGSGTTGVACKNINRNFIGIELNQEYYEIAKKRIN